MVEQLYYVQDARDCVGNCILWWCPARKGYTTELDKAGLYTRAQVLDMRDTDKAWPKEIVEATTVRHVRADSLRRSIAAELNMFGPVEPRDWLAMVEARLSAKG